MKSRTWMCTTAVSLFAAVALPIGMDAQNNSSQNHKPNHQKYKLIDLGTLGGPNSNLSGPDQRVLNNLGTLAAVANTSATNPNPGCYNPFSEPSCFVTHSVRWRNGVLTDLGTLPGGNNSGTTAISDSGLIVGASENGLVDPLTGLPEANAVLWEGGNIINLGAVPGGTESLATVVNIRGQITGFSNNGISDPFSIVGFPTQTRAFLWQKGALTDLGTLGGPDALASNENERGQVAGLSYANSTPNATTGIPTLDPFLWEDGTMRDLGTLGGTIGYPNWLNNRGQVVGNSNLAGDSAHHPFLWSKGIIKDLGTLGGANGEAIWINDAGDVAGWAAIPAPCSGCDAPGNQVYHATLWNEGRIKDLGTVPGDKCSIAFGMNDRGQVVGASGICHGSLHAFLWERGGPMVDVNLLVSPKSDITVLYPWEINVRGEIAAKAVLPSGDHHAVLLVPDGDCDDDTEARIAASQTNAAAAAEADPLTGAAVHSGETEGVPINSPPHQFGQRYHIPGQHVVPPN